MFDSPFTLCPRRNEMVLLDQTLKECAREHRCRDTKHCPLARYFRGVDFTHPIDKESLDAVCL